jgi:hypothetical protein
MVDTTRNIAPEGFCPQCGTPSEAGRIFCMKCAAELRPSSSASKVSHRLPSARSTKAILVLFVLFVVVDFVLGYFRGRSFSAGVISIFGGLLSTAFYLTLFWWRSGPKSADEADDDHSKDMARGQHLRDLSR